MLFFNVTGAPAAGNGALHDGKLAGAAAPRFAGFTESPSRQLHAVPSASADDVAVDVPGQALRDGLQACVMGYSLA